MTVPRPATDPAPHPPRPRLDFAVGVACHRDLGSMTSDGVVARVADVLQSLQQTIAACDTGPWYDGQPARLRLVSTLAEMADRATARTAMSLGFSLEAVLPFALAHYREAFADPAARHDFDALWQLASSTLELPGLSNDKAAAHALAEEALVAHSSVILAFWDGEAAPDGAIGEMVTRAFESDVPVVQVPWDATQPVRLIWSQFAPIAVTKRVKSVLAAQIFGPETTAMMISEILLPPEDEAERALARQYFSETTHPTNYRIEYPLLLAFTGTVPLRKTAWDKTAAGAAAAKQWDDFATAGGAYAKANDGMLIVARDAGSWADHLGRHYAQDLRSALVFNFAASAFAVLLALFSLVLPTSKLFLALLEIVMIVLIILNIRHGTTAAWQRRWLDYRSIAERLRPYRSLKLLGIATPPYRIQRRGNHPRRWIDWYVTAIWRAMGLPQGHIDAVQKQALSQLLCEQELAPIIANYRTEADRMTHLEDRLHFAGNAAFLTTLIVCLAFPALYLTQALHAYAWSNIFVVLSAGLPAVGGATYALRVHGDYAGAAGRALQTAASLESLRQTIATVDLPLTAVGTLATAAARVMLVDLDEWQLTYEQRSLAIPS